MNISGRTKRLAVAGAAVAALLSSTMAPYAVSANAATDTSARGNASNPLVSPGGGRLMDPMISDAEGGLTPASREKPVYTFVSAPDLTNGDMGNLRRLKNFRKGMPNSWSPGMNRHVKHVWSHLASFNADDIFMAGDAVNGHWDKDRLNTGIFGPVKTVPQKKQAIRRAGDFYYSEWKRFFAQAGVSMSDVHPALGDHELGDNDWPGSKAMLVPAYKDVWARNFTHSGNGFKYASHPTGRFAKTAYATYVHPKLLLVTVDGFNDSRTGMRTDIGGDQLSWLRKVLAAAPKDAQIIVQGHNPTLSPVRVRGSSGLMVEGGENSAFWQALRKYDVDFYFAGEVHATTMTQKGTGEPVQLVHGGVAASGRTKFVVGRLYADGRMELDTREMGTISQSSAKAWQTQRTIPASVVVDDSVSIGTAIVRNGVITHRTGVMTPYFGN